MPIIREAEGYPTNFLKFTPLHTRLADNASIVVLRRDLLLARNTFILPMEGETRHKGIRINMRQVKFINEDALMVFQDVNRSFKNIGLGIIFEEPQASVMRKLDTTGFSSLFDIYIAPPQQ
jgi:anti-anti-sigma regulatory factor